MAYNVEKLSTIDLGRQGENLARTVEIDVSSLLAQWPDASISLLCKRKHDTVPYVAVTEVKDGMLIWPITSVETEAAGDGKIELRAVCGEVIAKSMTAVIRVTASLTGSETEAPDAAQGWVDQVLAAGNGVEAKAVRAEAAAVQAEEAVARAEEVVAAIGDSVEQAQEASRLAGEEAAAAEASAEQARQIAEDISAEAERIETAVADAELAAGKIDGMKVSAETLEAGLPATVTIDDDGTVKTISFGIPKGDPGEKPVRGEDYWTKEDKEQVVSEAVAETLEQVKTISFYFCSAEEVDENGMPVIAAPDDYTFYLVSSGEAEPNLFIEWVYLNEKWERFGSATIDLSGYVRNTDYAMNGSAGVIRTVTSLGHSVSSEGYLQHQVLTESLVNAKNSTHIPITTKWIDYVIKVGVTTNTLELNEEEQDAAQKWLGTGEIVDDDAVANDHTWSSQRMLEKLTIPFEASGSIVQCHPVENSPLSVKTVVEPVLHLDWMSKAGNTSQVTTTGKNLWSKAEVSCVGVMLIRNDAAPIEAGTYTISAVVTGDSDVTRAFLLFYDDTSSFGVSAFLTVNAGRASCTFTLTKSMMQIGFYASQTAAESAGRTTMFSDIQIEAGTVSTSYEPYTGGMPSPSLEYPQLLMDNVLPGSYYVPCSASTGGYWRIEIEEALGSVAGTQDTIEVDSYTGRYRIKRTKKSYTITGDEDWNIYSNKGFLCANLSTALSTVGQIGTHFGYAPITASTVEPSGFFADYRNSTLYLRVEGITTVDGLKAFFKSEAEKGTPVTLLWPIAPITIAGQATHATAKSDLKALGTVSMGLTAPDIMHPCEISVATEAKINTTNGNLFPVNSYTSTSYSNNLSTRTYYNDLVAVLQAMPVTAQLRLTGEVRYTDAIAPTIALQLLVIYENGATVTVRGSNQSGTFIPGMMISSIHFYHGNSNVSGERTTTNIMLCFSNGIPNIYTVPRNSKYSVLLNENYAGGTLNLTSGSLTHEWERLELDGTEEWVDYYWNGRNGFRAKKPHKTTKANSTPYLCNVAGDEVTIWFVQGGANYLYFIGFADMTGMTLEEWVAFVQKEHLVIYHKLDKDIEEVSVEAQTVTALDGVNTIYSDAQSIVVSGRESPLHTIHSLTERIAALETAATST